MGEAYSASFRYIRQPDFYPPQEELDEIEKEKSQNTSILAASEQEESKSSSTKKTFSNLEDDDTEAGDGFQGLEVLD